MASVSTDRRYGINSGIAIKVPVMCATTANITLSGLQTIDTSYTTVAGDRVLVKNQTDSTQNGIYIADTGLWTRDADFDGSYDVAQGTLVSVVNGTTNGGTIWKVTTTNPSIGSAMAFALANDINIAANLAASSGSSLVGNIQPGTGSVAVTVQTALKYVVNAAVGWGIVGDGVTDDAPGINNALAYATSIGAILAFPIPSNFYGVKSKITPPLPLAELHMQGIGPLCTIKWIGAADATTAVFGQKASEIGTMNQSTIEGIRFDANKLAGYAVMFETTNTSGGAARREMEGNYFKNCWFQGASVAGFLAGTRNVINFAGLANDINFDQNVFDQCTFVNNNVHSVELNGVNVYNTKFRSCFFWSGNDGTINANGQYMGGYSQNLSHYLYIVGCGETNLDSCGLMAMYNTGGSGATPYSSISGASCIYLDTAQISMDNCQTEDCRVLYIAAGTQLLHSKIDGLVVNDSRTGSLGDFDSRGAYCVDNNGVASLSIKNSSFGNYVGTTNYTRKFRSVGPVTWENSRTSNSSVDYFYLGNPRASIINGRTIDDYQFMNKNWSLEYWGVPSATFENATTADYYCNGFMKLLDTGSQGTLQQSNLNLETGTHTGLITCTVYNANKGVRFVCADTIDVSSLRGQGVICVVTGTHDGTFTTSAQMNVLPNTDSTGGGSNFVIYGPPGSNLFAAILYQEISVAATYVQPEFNVKKTGAVYVDTFAVLPAFGTLGPIVDFSALWGISRYALALNQSDRSNLIKYEAPRLSESNNGAYTFTDTLSAGDNCMYFCSNSTLGSNLIETAIVLAGADNTAAFASKTSTAGIGASSITASAAGMVVSIAMTGTTKCFVRKVSLNS